MMRRSSALTSLTVWARSFGVAIGKGTVAICRQMSTAMMSAPSCASLTAWLRPWPRAAPVMKATMPSSFPLMLLCPFLVTNLFFRNGASPAAPGGQAGQRVLIAGAGGGPADGDRHPPPAVRVIGGRARPGGRACGLQRLLAQAAHALGVGAVQRQSGEELGR